MKFALKKVISSFIYTGGSRDKRKMLRAIMKIKLAKLKPSMEENNFIPNHQFDFREKHTLNLTTHNY